jgi:hypothetical protein
VLYRALVLTALLDIVYATYFKIIVNDPWHIRNYFYQVIKSTLENMHTTYNHIIT